MFESLESRRLMAITAAALDTTLYVWGDNAANGITVERSVDPHVGAAYLVVKEYGGGGHDDYHEIFRVLDSWVNTVRVYGYAGDDTITIADAVTDRGYVMGGSGADYLKAGGGETRLWGHGDWAGDPSGQHDPLTDDGAADTTISGRGYSIHHGQNGNDFLFTDTNVASGLDMLNGEEGNDTFYIRGHGERAYVYGGFGNDTFLPSQSATQPISIWAQGGTGDTLDFAGWTAAVHVDASGAALSGLRAGSRGLTINDGLDVVKGTAYNDYFYGSSVKDSFYGRGGSDTAYGNGGNDMLYGEAGQDRLVGNDGDDWCFGGTGNDMLFGEANNDRLYGEADNDTIYGGIGSDILVGGSGSDYIVATDGVAGNDFVYGDNTDGGGAAGFTDTALLDNSMTIIDAVHGVENILL
jgi:Ca2+-binding RTX toxin-like protein